jgi:hypothetical protein
MNPLIQLKKATPIFLGVFVLVCLTLSPRLQAVVPPPDGGYPNFTTAEGTNALFSLTTGSANTAVGWYSLWADAEGSFNTATGAGALLFNTSNNNTAFGAAALLFNSTGSGNTAVGTTALLNNVGSTVDMPNGDPGSFNTAVGFGALTSNTTGSWNTANGAFTLFNNTTGSRNTANGEIAGRSNTTGASNTANGYQALSSNTTGNSNTANGDSALVNNTSGSGNTALGSGAGSNVTTADAVICIGNAGQNDSASCYIGQIFDRFSSGGTAVFINSDGRLGTTISSRRFKDEIKPMERTSEALFALKPVTFRYKKQIDPQGIPQFGLVAEDVEAVNPDLVVRDKEGKVNTVRYDAVNAMVLNEFLKEHRKNEEQEATIAHLKQDSAKQQKQIETLTASLQRVSDQLELSKPAP